MVWRLQLNRRELYLSYVTYLVSAFQLSYFLLNLYIQEINNSEWILKKSTINSIRRYFATENSGLEKLLVTGHWQRKGKRSRRKISDALDGPSIACVQLLCKYYIGAALLRWFFANIIIVMYYFIEIMCSSFIYKSYILHRVYNMAYCQFVLNKLIGYSSIDHDGKICSIFELESSACAKSLSIVKDNFTQLTTGVVAAWDRFTAF